MAIVLGVVCCKSLKYTILVKFSLNLVVRVLIITLFLYFQGTLYLIKWSGYHTEQSTWEPEGHISQHLLDTYLQPSVSDCRVTDAAIRVEGAIQQRLRSRGNRCVVDFDLDIYRHCFASDRTILADKDDFDKLPMSAHWYYNVNKCGRGCQVSFPIKCEPKLYFRKTYAYCDGVVREVKVPCERLVLTSAVDGIAF